jgi:hypothetical protein
MSAFIEEYSYLTFTLVRGTLSEVQAEIKLLLEGPDDRPPACHYSYWMAPADPKSVYFPEPQGGARLPIVSMLWEPTVSRGLVAFMANSRDGWIQLIRHYSRRFPRDCLSIQTSRAGEEAIRNDFEFFRGGSEVRMVAAWMDEPGWQFYAKGDTQPFENVAYYSKKRIRDRLNRGIVVEYAQTFGADILDSAFWTSTEGAFWFKQLRD